MKIEDVIKICKVITKHNLKEDEVAKLRWQLNILIRLILTFKGSIRIIKLNEVLTIEDFKAGIKYENQLAGLFSFYNCAFSIKEHTLKFLECFSFYIEEPISNKPSELKHDPVKLIKAWRLPNNKDAEKQLKEYAKSLEQLLLITKIRDDIFVHMDRGDLEHPLVSFGGQGLIVTNYMPTKAINNKRLELNNTAKQLDIDLTSHYSIIDNYLKCFLNLLLPLE